MTMDNVSYGILLSDLRSLGVELGDTLVVHSSMKSMGNVVGGPDCVIHALLSAVGAAGTLMMPTFTYATSYKSSYYSNKATPSCVGLLTDTYRSFDGVIRTNHPTHSVALRGRLTEQLISGEELDDTPMGTHSPYRRLASVGAKILMLGCSLLHNSFMHGIEEEAELPYVLRGHQEYTVVDEYGRESLRRIRRHNFTRPDGALIQRYDRTLSVLDGGDYKIGKIHGAESVLIDCAALRKKALSTLSASPLYFVDDPDGYYPEYK